MAKTFILMGCCGQSTRKQYVMGICDVCREVNNDLSEKKVFWCSTCKAYICSTHEKDLLSRAKAAAKVALKKFIKL